MAGITLMLLGNHAGAAGVTPAQLWVWGGNYNGAQGMNEQAGGAGERSSPIQLGSEADWLQFTGAYSFAATRESGYIYACGDSRWNASTPSVNNSSPVQIGALTNWTGGSLAATSTCTRIIKGDGTMWAWGANYEGAMGTGAGDSVLYSYSSPVQIGSLTTWGKTKNSVAGGGYQPSAGINASGELFCWGVGNYGANGQNNVISYSSPVQVGSLTNWSQVVAGSGIIMSLKTDGTLWSWGENDYGQLGQNYGTGSNVSSPVQIGSATDWEHISLGYQNAGAIRSGKLYCWGRNVGGGVGDGTVISRSSPVQKGALTTWDDVQAGNDMTLAKKADGTIWAWGANWYGQAGQNTSTGVKKYSSPVQIGSGTTWTQIQMGNNTSSVARASKT